MGRITARTRSPDRASRVREADHRRSESGAAAAVGDWDRDFATHPADLAGGRQSIVCFFLFLFTLYTQMYYSCWLDRRVCRCISGIPCRSATGSIPRDENGTEIFRTERHRFEPIDFVFSDKFEFGSKFGLSNSKTERKRFNFFPTVFYFSTFNSECIVF